MVLNVECPDPPDLTNRGLPSDLDAEESIGSESDLRREELETILRDGAWHEAFNEWAEYTDLTESEYRAVHDAGLIERLDVFWDPVEKRLRFEVPSLPDEWQDREDLAPKITAELTDLGRTVVEMLEDAYVDWGKEGTADVFWSEEASSEEPPPDD